MPNGRAIIIAILLVSLLIIASCTPQRDAFKLCLTNNEYEFVEIDFEAGYFASMDYFGAIEHCDSDVACIKKPLLFSVPSREIEGDEYPRYWTADGFSFSIAKVDSDQFIISVSAPWGDEEYEYSARSGIEKRTVTVPSGDVEEWVVCGGRLKFSDLASASNALRMD